MGVTIKVPTSPDLASSYRAATFWDDSGLRAGLEHIADVPPPLDRPVALGQPVDALSA